jgi:cytochrome c peroxidase
LKKSIKFFVVSILLASFCSKGDLTAYKFPVLNYFPPMPVAANNPLTVEGAALGRFLFYDSTLSKDYTMSCASCHKVEHAFSDAGNAFSAGRNGTKMTRNTMPLFNLAWYPSYFWDGRASSIEQQVFHPVREYNEMNLDWPMAEKRLNASNFYKQQFKNVFGNTHIDSVTVSLAIAQFLRTLISYQSKYDKAIAHTAEFTREEYEGMEIANGQTKGDCIHCHNTDGNALATNLFFTNNGLDEVSDAQNFKDKGYGAITGKASDNGKFRVPSLRNLAFTAPYMHDGRFKTLEEVVDFYSEGVKRSATIDSKMEYVHSGGVRLTSDEKKKLITFLLALSDSSFVANKEYGNPFAQN